ncbi:MAG: isoprenyl transferase [Clostridia bacterium]|nr:isoprenyl transferase [Clostridia bacterium]
MSNELPCFDVLPQHIAVIMDGNGRWAKQRGLERTEGHKAGAENFRRIVDYASRLGIKYMTFYAFSTENWKRPEFEVKTIMNLIRKYLKEMQLREAENEASGYNIHFIGNREGLDDDIVKLFNTVEKRSSKHNKTYVNIAVNYGGREEITHSVRVLCEKVKNGELISSDITENTVASYLYTAGQPDPDLIIRPSGEQRLSNFLIWQAAYSEFWYSDVLWPDFNEQELNRALEDYAHRHRRFGGI